MQKTAYEMRISDWSSDVCSSDLQHAFNFECRIKSPAVRQHKGPFPHSLIGFIDSQIHQALLLDAYGPSTLEYAEISFLSDRNQAFDVVHCCTRVDSMTDYPALLKPDQGQSAHSFHLLEIGSHHV